MGIVKLGFCPTYNKVKYLNRKLAEQFIEENNYPLRAYHCKACDYFHLTGREDRGRNKLTGPVTKNTKRKKPRRLI